MGILPCRGGNDCGIASDAVYPKVADKYVVPGAVEKAMAMGIARGKELQMQEEGRLQRLQATVKRS